MPHRIFRLSELYTNLGLLLRSGANRSPWALLVRRRTRLWSDVSFQFWQSKSISADFTAWRCYHVSCTLSAPSRRRTPTSFPTSTGPTPSSCFTPGFGMAVSQNTLRLFLAQARTCNFDDCAVRFGSCQIVPGAVVSKHVKIHCSGYTFRSISVSRLRRLLADKDSELGVLALQKSKVGALVMVPSAPVYGH